MPSFCLSGICWVSIYCTFFESVSGTLPFNAFLILFCQHYIRLTCFNLTAKLYMILQAFVYCFIRVARMWWSVGGRWFVGKNNFISIGSSKIECVKCLGVEWSSIVQALVGWIELFVWGAEEKLPSDEVIHYLKTLNVSLFTVRSISNCNCSPNDLMFLCTCFSPLNYDFK